MTAPGEMLEAALDYAAMGWHVFPVWWPVGAGCACPAGAGCGNPGKHPIPRRGLLEATTSEPMIHLWWTANPLASIGVAMRASGLIAFDVDKYKDDDARLAAAEQRLGPLPAAIVQDSGSGAGLHAFYAAPREAGDFVPTRGDLDGVTLRARAYVVAAPSRHASGGCYQWRPGCSPRDRAPVDLPAAWVEAVRRPAVDGSGAGVPPADEEPEWLREIPEAERVAQMRAHLDRETGEIKGQGRPGQAFNVARTCARGYAVREPRHVYGALIQIYNPKCRPPYDPYDLGRRVNAAYDVAEQPEWGALLRPPDLARQELGLGPFATPSPAPVQASPIPAGALAAAEAAILDPAGLDWPCDDGAADDGDPWLALAGSPRGGGAPGGFITEAVAASRAETDAKLMGTLAIDLVPRIREESLLPLIALPFGNVNAKIGGGLPVHSNNILVAPSGAGKSSFAGACAGHHAVHAPVVYYVGEMTETLMVSRIIGQIASRSWLDVVRGRLTDEEMIKALAGLKLYTVRRQEHPLRAIRATVDGAMRLAGAVPDPARRGAWVNISDGRPSQMVPMVIIDYIQLLASLGQGDIRAATAAAVREVQQYFEEVVAVGLTLSQASRDASRRIREGSERSEDLSDVGAETAELERSATYQFVLSYQKKDDVEEHEVAFTIAKGRFGGGSRLGLKFNGRTGCYTEMDGPPASEEDLERRAEILAQVRIHAERACLAGGPCGRPLTAASFLKQPHRVAGGKPAIDRALRDLERAGLIARRAGSITLGGAPGRGDA